MAYIRGRRENLLWNDDGGGVTNREDNYRWQLEVMRYYLRRNTGDMNITASSRAFRRDMEDILRPNGGKGAPSAPTFFFFFFRRGPATFKFIRPVVCIFLAALVRCSIFITWAAKVTFNSSFEKF